MDIVLVLPFLFGFVSGAWVVNRFLRNYHKRHAYWLYTQWVASHSVLAPVNLAAAELRECEDLF